MKNLKLAIACITLTTFVSCSNNDDSIDSKRNEIITSEKLVPVNSALPDTWELDINNNFLNKIIINAGEDRFTYSNGKVIEINHFSNNTYLGVDTFTYNEGKIQTITNTNSNDITTMVRTFDYTNPNGLIKETVVLYDSSGMTTGTYDRYKKIENGNLINNDLGTSQKDTYTYDNKANFFSNLNSLNEIILYYSNDRVGKNNRVTSVSNFYYNSNLISTSNIDYNNSYDSNSKIKSRIVSIGGLEHYKETFSLK